MLSSWINRGISLGVQNPSEIERSLDASSGKGHAPASAEGPAAEFRGELYGIVEPLLKRLPHSPHAHLLVASVHRRFARKAEATRELRQCLAIDPLFVEAHYTLGLVALHAGNYPGAEMHLRDAFQIAPAAADVPLQLAQAQMSQGKFREATLTLDTYLRLETADAEAWCQLGLAYQELGDFINAKRCHLTAIGIDPGAVKAHYGVAKALQELNEEDEAREYFDRFRRMRQSATASVRSDKATWTDEGRVQTAIVKTLTEAGSIYARHGNLVEAEECWTRATALNPNHAECLELLCHLRPNAPDRWLRLGHLYIQGGCPAEAEEPLRRVVELAPQHADGYAALAEVCVRLGKAPEEALQLAQTAVKLESTAPNFYVLAAACERAGNWAEAESALTRAIKLDPANPQYREARAKLHEGRPK